MNTAFVTYFDILGFKEIVDNRSEEEIIDILNRFRNLNTSSYNGAEALIHSFKGEYKFTNFSDCIVRSLSFGKKLSIEDKLFFLELEISEIADIQYRLLVEKGVLLRGGLSYGEIHHSEEYIFGKALNKSYGFESKYSVYPRVIIDNDIIDDIIEYSNTGHYFPCGKSVNGLELSKILKKDNDGLYFIDYLQNLFEKAEIFEINIQELAERHKDTILLGFEDIKTLDVAQKHNWLINYHNSFINRNGKKYIDDVNPRLEIFRIEDFDNVYFKDLNIIHDKNRKNISTKKYVRYREALGIDKIEDNLQY